MRHIFIANYIYELPFFRNQNNLAGRFPGGWQFGGIVQFQTGTPSSVAVSTDYVGVGMDGSMSNGGRFWSYSQIPDVTHQIALNGTSDPYFWFATKDSSGNAIFTQPTKGTFVHQPNIRNIIHNPGLENWNVGLFKKIAVTEKVAFQFRAEAFDVLNRPNWSGAGFNPTSASFGKITGKTGDVRNMQLSLRLSF